MPMPSALHTERVFENELCDHLSSHGWTVLTHLQEATGYNRELALFPDDLLAFVQETQPEEWSKFRRWHNGSSGKVFVQRVAEQLNKHGTLAVLRHGFRDRDARFQLCQFAPASSKNKKLVQAYEANRLTAIRQLHYSPFNQKSFDLVLFVNGLPVATAELKTELTQSVAAAILQYQQDRPVADAVAKQPEPLLQFKTRALVHFAVSTDEVFMTTKLQGPETSFLPFNKGIPDGHGGAGKGNPAAPPGKGYRSYYLWEKVWERGTWLELLGSFLHLEKKTEESKGKLTTKENLIFPRWHQLTAVHALLEAAAKEGPGYRYLVQHSAGSGKSNTIAWTAHRLTSLHNRKGEKVFDTVVVITDRKVLDRQLQETISQFDHKPGVIQKIDEDSKQLAQALNDGTPIVVTTLQKFSFVLKEVKNLGKRSFAVLVDEAHSSQSGVAAENLRKTLSKQAPAEKLLLHENVHGEDKTVEAVEDLGATDELGEDEINSQVVEKGLLPNISYFAFTATPKVKTLELFGRPDDEGRPRPFHVYSMKQAIEEGFILDVLKHFTSYETYFQIRAKADERVVEEGAARKLLSQYATLHPYNISQKVAVIVEHFRDHVARELRGRAKAMVVTDSRKSAVRYKLSMDKYLKDKGYTDLQTLVAFSGTVPDESQGPTPVDERKVNGLGDVEPATAFKADEYRVLLVANKYVTGFDQPLLMAMYVDKKLSGVMAVQTLSRLNRTYPGKTKTFVLDFVNKPEDILESFAPYYRATKLEKVTDPNILHELAYKLDRSGVYTLKEVELVDEAFKSPSSKQAKLHALQEPARQRFEALSEADAELFRKDMRTFLRLYDFLGQMVPYTLDIEQRVNFFRCLAKYLIPRGRSVSLGDLEEELQLTHYRLQKVSEKALDLESQSTKALLPIVAAGSGSAQELEAELGVVVEEFNARYPGITSADLLGFLQPVQDRLLKNEVIQDQARNNTFEQFQQGEFKNLAIDALLDSHDTQKKLADIFLQDPDAKDKMLKALMRAVFSVITAPAVPV